MGRFDRYRLSFHCRNWWCSCRCFCSKIVFKHSLLYSRLLLLLWQHNILPHLDIHSAERALSKIFIKLRSVYGRHRCIILYYVGPDDVLHEVHNRCNEWGFNLHNSPSKLFVRLRLLQSEIWNLRDLRRLPHCGDKWHHRVLKRIWNNKLN